LNHECIKLDKIEAIDDKVNKLSDNLKNSEYRLDRLFEITGCMQKMESYVIMLIDAADVQNKFNDGFVDSVNQISHTLRAISDTSNIAIIGMNKLTEKILKVEEDSKITIEATNIIPFIKKHGGKIITGIIVGITAIIAKLQGIF